MSSTLTDPLFETLEQLAQYGIPGKVDSSSFDIGTSDYLSFFSTEFVAQNVLHGNSICRFFEGPYGSGKTHLLSLLAKVGERNSFAVVRVDLSQALSITDWDQFTRKILNDMQLVTDQGVVKSLPSIIEYIGSNKNPKSNILIESRLPHPGFARAMDLALSMSHKSNDYKRTLSDFLLGSKVLTSELKHYNLVGVRSPLIKKNADQVLKTALNGLYLLGVPTMLLIDENERTLAQGNEAAKKKQSLAANLLRRMVDACASGQINGSVIVFTLLPNFIEMCAREYPALGQRLRTVPPNDLSASWRSTVLSVEEVSSASHPDHFGELAVKKFSEIYASLCSEHGAAEPANKVTQILQSQTKQILQKTAGAGYKRELIKALASKVLKELREIEEDS